jgi:hypothetical protein
MSLEVPIIILILTFPIYFLTKWVLMRLKLGNKNSRKYLAIIPTVILSPLLYIGIIMIWIFSVSYYPKTDFNKQEWNENKEEVIELLGDDSYFYDESHIAYDLGFVPGLFNIDPDVLDIYFEKGKVTKVGQHET